MDFFNLFYGALCLLVFTVGWWDEEQVNQVTDTPTPDPQATTTPPEAQA